MSLAHLLCVLCMSCALLNGVQAHGYLSSPLARTGDESTTGGVKKFAFYLGYGDATNATLYTKYRNGCRPAPADAPAQDTSYSAAIEGPAVGTFTNYTLGVPVNLAWVITVNHDSAPGVQVSVDYAGGTNFTTIASGVDVNALKLSWTPSQVSDHAVIQWIWESKADGGGYLGCADIRVAAAAPGANSSNPTTSPGHNGAARAPILSLSTWAMLCVCMFIMVLN